MQCGFKASDPTENGLIPKIAEHAAKAHKIMNIDAALLANIKAAIKE